MIRNGITRQEGKMEVTGGKNNNQNQSKQKKIHPQSDKTKQDRNHNQYNNKDIQIPIIEDTSTKNRENMTNRNQIHITKKPIEYSQPEAQNLKRGSILS